VGGLPDELADVARFSADAPEVEKLVNAIIPRRPQQKAFPISTSNLFERNSFYATASTARCAKRFGPALSLPEALIAKIKIMTNQMDITSIASRRTARIQ